MEKSRVLLSTAYAGPVQWFAALAGREEVYLEQRENYIKQTYRNRCVILGANGPLTLVIPVEHGRSPGVPVRDIRIAHYDPWQRSHWRTIYSAYNNSPFFEHYADDFSVFYEKKFDFLFDFNQQLLVTILSAIELKQEIRFTEMFESVPAPFDNLREAISPKNKSFAASFVPYTQVFDDKFPFIPNLSIFDLLFNVGPGSLLILRQMNNVE